MEGWIKLHRKILNNEIWNDPTAFRLFILLLLNASHEDGRKINGIELKRGQWIRSYSKLSEDLGYRVGRGIKNVSRSTVCRTIEKLKSFGMVTVDETDSGTLFTITNYQYYQGFASDEENNSGTVSGTKAEQRRNKGGTKAEPKQECKNERMEEGINNNVGKKFSDDHEATILTKLLVKLMLQNNPNARIPKTEKQKERWIDSLEKIHRLDGYSYDQIKKAIIWSQNNDFWKANILSTKKLREKMPTLVLQMDRNQSKPQSRPMSRYERTVSELDRLYQEALANEQEGNNQTD